MLYTNLKSCPQCANIPNIIKDIDCVFFELSLKYFNNITLLLNKKINKQAMFDLLVYRRILLYKKCNPNYAGECSVNSITNKVKLLKYK